MIAASYSPRYTIHEPKGTFKHCITERKLSVQRLKQVNLAGWALSDFFLDSVMRHDVWAKHLPFLFLWIQSWGLNLGL